MYALSRSRRERESKCMFQVDPGESKCMPQVDPREKVNVCTN